MLGEALRALASVDEATAVILENAAAARPGGSRGSMQADGEGRRRRSTWWARALHLVRQRDDLARAFALLDDVPSGSRAAQLRELLHVAGEHRRGRRARYEWFAATSTRRAPWRQVPEFSRLVRSHCADAAVAHGHKTTLGTLSATLGAPVRSRAAARRRRRHVLCRGAAHGTRAASRGPRRLARALEPPTFAPQAREARAALVYRAPAARAFAARQGRPPDRPPTSSDDDAKFAHDDAGRRRSSASSAAARPRAPRSTPSLRRGSSRNLRARSPRAAALTRPLTHSSA